MTLPKLACRPNVGLLCGAIRLPEHSSDQLVEQVGRVPGMRCRQQSDEVHPLIRAGRFPGPTVDD